MHGQGGRRGGLCTAPLPGAASTPHSPRGVEHRPSPSLLSSTFSACFFTPGGVPVPEHLIKHLLHAFISTEIATGFSYHAF